MLYVGAHVCITTCATIMCTTCEVSQRKQGYQVLLSLSQRVAENLAKQASQRGEREDPSLSLLPPVLIYAHRRLHWIQAE
jgi:hypothetical protein